MELRFNPMKRNRGGEQDLDHIIGAAIRGMDRAMLEYPVTPGLIFCLDRAFPYELNEIIAEKAIAWRDRGVVGVDIAGPGVGRPSASPTTGASSPGPPARARASPSTPAKPGPVEEVAEVIEQLEPDRASATASRRPTTRARWRCSASGASSSRSARPRTSTRGVVSGWDEFRWIFDTVPPQRRALHDQHRRPGDAQDLHPRRAHHARAAGHPVDRGAGSSAAEWARQASFVAGVSDVPSPKRRPPGRSQLEREEA